MATPGERLDVSVEKPVAGGRMLARHEGQVVFVAHAIPGERVRATVERVRGGVVYADATEVLEPHAARREPACPPACGGMTYAHIDPAHQRVLKAEIVADAFARIGKLPLDQPPEVAASPERGYRMRARLHVRGGRLGGFLEGSHDICDYTGTGQLLDASNAVVREVGELLQRTGIEYLSSIEIAENLDAAERVLHVDTAGAPAAQGGLLADLGRVPGVTGVSFASGAARPIEAAGRASVSDRLDAFVRGVDARSAPLPLQRRARSFFQANRFLTPPLAAAVVDAVAPGLLVDLYAGVGLFAIGAAARGQSLVVAVEGEPTSAADLRRNAAPFRASVRVHVSAVEEFLGQRFSPPPATVVVDPPRTGMSRAAVDGVLHLGAARVVYVSCDVATLARDAARLVAAGYAMTRLSAFDLFPNTPHVESLAVFDAR